MRVLWKAPAATFVILWHILEASIVRLFVRDIVRVRKYYFRQISRRARQLEKFLSLDVILEGAENARPGQNYLMVANHHSYLDAVVISAYRPTSFVTSIEMREVPLLGLITELGGCLYVERRSKENIHREISGIVEALKQGFNVVVFPEATSTNGEKLMPFKRPLFAAAPAALTPVLPIALIYENVNGVPLTKLNRDTIYWYGDMGFAGHFLRLAAQKSVRVRIKVLPEFSVTPETTRDTLAEEAFARISGHFRPV